MLPGRADALPVDPRPPRPRPPRPVEPAGRRHRRRRHPGRAHPPDRRRAAVLDRRHRLRADRGRHGHAPPRPTTTPRRSPPPSAGRARASSSASSTATTATCPPARPARSCSAGRQRDGRLPRRPRRHRRGALARRLAAHRRPRRRSTSAGYLRIVGRAKDMFIVGGFNAYPAEIENALLRHPDVAAGRGHRHPRRAPRRGGHGLRRDPRRATRRPATAILAWCRDADGQLQGAPGVEIVDELPVNATGKVEKDELRARAAQGGPVSAP